MSLIFDALRKAEREKEAPARGVQVVSAQAWTGARRSWRGPLAIAGLLALTAIGGAAWLYRMLHPEPRALMGPVAVRSRRSDPPPSDATTPRGDPGPADAAAERTDPREPAPGSAGSTEPPAADAPPPQALELPGSATRRSGAGTNRTAPPARTGPPAGETTGGATALHLNAISTKDGRRVALLNDRLVFEGDSFDGITVLRIGDADVEVRVNGERRVVGF